VGEPAQEHPVDVDGDPGARHTGDDRRIHGEFASLGYQIGASTVGRRLREPHLGAAALR
jgi:hypothetical protein